MKRIFQYLFVLVVIINLSSCYTTEKFVVNGKAGTGIYTPEGIQLSTIGDNGQAQVSLSSDECYTYLLAKENQSNSYVPFALDYHNKSYAGTKTLSALAYAMAGVGGFCELVGLIATLAGDGEVGTPFVVAGAPLLVGGGFMGMVTSNRLSQTTRQWQFAYLKQQQTNSDIRFTKPVYTEPVKKLALSESSSQRLLTNAGWKQEQNNTIELPFKSGTFDVIQVASYFNNNSIKMEPEGQITIKNNVIQINIHGNSYLQDKTIRITKDLKRNKRFGNPAHTFDLYETSDGQEIGIYSDDSFGGVKAQVILIPINESVTFEISWI